MNTALLLSARRSPFGASAPAPRTVSRADHDFYPTPPEAVHALLSVERFDGPIWEPACGDGAIAEVLKHTGHTIVATDLIDRDYGEGGCDFLSPLVFTRITIEYPDLKHVVTNPPYSYRPGIGDKFVGQALRFARQRQGKVAMLLNLGCLAHRTRTPKWRNDPPARIHIMDELVCWPYGDRRLAGRTIAEHRYCWIVWDSEHKAPTRLTWLRMADFKGQGGRS